MKKPDNPSHGIETWNEVIQKIQATDSSHHSKMMDRLRKITYNHSLKHQMQQNEHKQNKKNHLKQRQRQEIVQQSLEEKKIQQGKLYNKLKTEQWYQDQNKSLIEERKKHVESSEDFSRNTFINKIIDEGNQRKMQTRLNFKLQNSLNDRQVQIKQTNRERAVDEKFRDRDQYDSYIENEYRKHQRQRELWKNKYIHKGRYSGEDDTKAYSSYLDKQILEQQERKRQAKLKIDPKLKQLNQNVDVPSSSPAYLGRISQSSDRRYQLNIIDRHMNFNPSQLILRQQQTERVSSVSPTPVLPVLTARPQQLIRQIPPPPAATKMVHNQSAGEIRNRRKFTSYDFITGNDRTFFI